MSKFVISDRKASSSVTPINPACSLFELAPNINMRGFRGADKAISTTAATTTSDTSKAIKMPKSSKWRQQENADLAQAFIEVSEDEGSTTVVGTGQDGLVFWARVFERFKAKAPDDAASGSYGGRNVKTASNHFRDDIARECKKFNKCLLKIHRSKPTGCNDQNKINMAVAIIQGKIDCMSHRFKDHQAMDWKFYEAWLILKSHPAFLPPTQEQIAAAEEVEEEVEEESTGNNSPTPDGEAIIDSASSSIAISSTRAVKSRGGAGGRDATKKKSMEEDLKKRKVETLEQMLDLQKKKAKAQEGYCKNVATAQAWKMAKEGHLLFKDDDPEEASECSTAMRRILMQKEQEELQEEAGEQ